MSWHGPINLQVNIPREVLYRLLISLSISDIDNFCETNIALSLICQDENFWQLKVTTDYPTIIQPIKSWKYTAHLLQPKTIPVSECVEFYDRGHHCRKNMCMILLSIR